MSDSRIIFPDASNTKRRHRGGQPGHVSVRADHDVARVLPRAAEQRARASCLAQSS